MLASQESVLRSQPSEADYRAATVKQRPTSRRITPAEISVSATYTLHTGRLHKLLRYSIFSGRRSAQGWSCSLCRCAAAMEPLKMTLLLL